MMNTLIPVTNCVNATYEFINRYIQQFHYAPTVAEIASAHGIAKSVVHRRLQTLVRAGWITRARYKARAIKVTRREAA